MSHSNSSLDYRECIVTQRNDAHDYAYAIPHSKDKFFKIHNHQVMTSFFKYFLLRLGEHSLVQQ